VNEIGSAVPARIVFAQTEKLAIAIVGLVAYSTGFGGEMSLRFHHDSAAIDIRGPHPFMPRFGTKDMTDETLRFGVEFADGRRATNLDPFPDRSGIEPPIALRSGGGGGGSNSYKYGFWVYPLPPPGEVTLAVEWLAQGVDLTQRAIDANAIIEAASRSVTLWEDNRPTSLGAPSTGHVMGSEQSVMSATTETKPPPDEATTPGEKQHRSRRGIKPVPPGRRSTPPIAAADAEAAAAIRTELDLELPATPRDS
jgi:hypothetical protein